MRPEKPAPPAENRPPMAEHHFEEKIHQSEERYRHLIEAVTDYVFTVRVEHGRAVETIHGPGCRAVTGYSEREFQADPGLWLRMVPEEDRALVTKQVGDILSGRETQAIEHRITRKDGEVRWFRHTAVSRSDGKGRLTSYDGLITDITRQKQAEDALRESEARYRLLIETLNEGIWVIDKDAVTTYVNPKMAEILGYTVGEMIGHHLFTFMDEEGRRICEQNIERRRKGIKEQHDFEFLKKDGTLIYASLETTPILGKNGEYLGAIAGVNDITGRKQAEEALRESEERYGALFYHNYSISLLIDPDTGVIVDANEAAGKYYGYTRDQLRSLGIYDLNRLQKEKVVQDLGNAKNQKEKHFLSTHYLADGQKRSVEVYSGPIRVNGKPLFYSIIHDITDRITAEQALRESESTLNTILQCSPIPKFVIDTNHRVISWNKALEEITGIKARDAIGTKMHWRAFYTAERPCLADLLVDGDIENIRRLYAGNYKESDTSQGTFEVTDFFPNLGENGRWLHFIAAPIIDSSGSMIGAVETLEDITGLVETGRALRESEEQYRTLIDQLPDYVIVHRNGILLYVNPAAASHLGYENKDLIGKPITLFIMPEHHENVKQAIITRMAGGVVIPYEMNILAQDGTRHSILVNGARIQYMGEPASLNVLTDITRIKEAEETIRHANEILEMRVAERTKALEHANEQMEEEIAARKKAEEEISRSLEDKIILLREIHHRVKNNLQIIASLLNLQSRYITDEKVLEAIQDSQSRVRAMALVHERIYRSHDIAEINLKEYLNFLAKQVFQFYNIHAPRHNLIGIRVSMDDIMADIDTVIPVGLIMNELVSNSLKHAFPDGRNGTISIECSRESADTLRFVYHDTGKGMPEGFDWRNTESLGLRLVNSLVDQLNGSVELGVGEGTTFIIRIRKNPSDKTR